MALLLGLLLSVTSSLTGFAALNLQKLAQHKERPRPTLNLIGVGLSIVVGPLDMVAYSLAPQSLLAPVGTLSLVFNLVAAPVLHGDQVTRRDVLATVLIVLGTAFCLLFGARGTDESSDSPAAASGPDEHALLCYAILVGTLAAALASVVFAQRENGGHSDAAANAMLAGLLGSTTVVASKCIGATASAPETSLLAVIRSALPLASLVPCHLYSVNRGMGRHSSLVMVPGAAAAGLLSNISSGFFLYGEVPDSAVYFGFGVLLLLGGVMTLIVPAGAAAPPRLPDAVRRSISGAEKGALSPNNDDDTAAQVEAFARRRYRS